MATNFYSAAAPFNQRPVAPTTEDDRDSGYAVGAFWQDTETNKVYLCTDNSVGAAVWIEVTYTAPVA